MRRTLTAALLALTGLAGCRNQSVCGEYATMNLPGVTKIDSCDANPKSEGGLGGETTASGEDFMKAIGSSGYELGRDGDSTFGNARTMLYFRNAGQTYFMFTDLKPRGSGNNYFSIGPKPQPKNWLPEAAWQKVLARRADQKVVLERVGKLGELLKSNTKAPAICAEALESLDPNLAKSAKNVLVNLDSRELRGKDGRGPATLRDSLATDDDSTEYGSKLSVLVAAREEIDRLAARRILPVVSITDYVAASQGTPKPGDLIRFVSLGAAKFEVAIVDTKEGRVLCRTKAETETPKTPPKNAPTLKGKDGKEIAIWMESVTDKDLSVDQKISVLARAQLAKMSPAFAQ